MNLRVGRNGEDQEMDCVADGEAVELNDQIGRLRKMHAQASTDGMRVLIQRRLDALEAEKRQTGAGQREAVLMASLSRAIRRDPNPNGRWKGAILSEDGTELLIDTADGRTFIASIREV